MTPQIRVRIDQSEFDLALRANATFMQYFYFAAFFCAAQRFR